MTSCSDSSGTASSSRSKAASIASSVASSVASSAASAVASAVPSLASQGASALASASAEARRRLEDVQNGIDAKDDVHLGTPATDADGRSTVAVRAHNSADSAKSFAVQVDFRDQAGNLLDTTVVTLNDVGAGKDGKATAHSNRKLSGPVRTDVARAVRY
ncbi:hypothetical protein [Streptomyces griseorubiginosus]|uniref:hypothetical protein n=1 Tax=Streptomyces griseorubiginosus TaxID=67304 RepID=UPI001AD6DE84|nr:hypothetical protein [Streptomyces griseorubiginosus]MBO4257041.1 hypothetical protein [Streptomyces griseorubiginosus]